MPPRLVPGPIVVLTGAGISAESGLATFRGAGGLWEGHRVEDVATPQAFRRDPALVYGFYDMRRRRLREPGQRSLLRVIDDGIGPPSAPIVEPQERER